jgi:hypothetical protein
MEIKIENQIETVGGQLKWGNHYLAKTKTSFAGYGCKLFCLTYLYSVKKGRQYSPDTVNTLLYEGGAFTGDLLDDVTAAKVLGFQFLGRETNIEKAPDWTPTIKEVRFSKTWGQHFVVRIIKPDGSKKILDPYGGLERKINFYELKCGTPNWEKGKFSYRKFKI